MASTWKRFTLALVFAGAAALLMSGCGNTWYGMGQDMETLGRRIQHSQGTPGSAPANNYDYYRSNPQPQPYRGAY
ncbi:MAG TPA: hypothetical protein VMN36_09555 [Verrucomicrobiales bacterium]|nr:hypothetical protein [Verrucomicrobiales bacterium]